MRISNLLLFNLIFLTYYAFPYENWEQASGLSGNCLFAITLKELICIGINEPWELFKRDCI